MSLYLILLAFFVVLNSMSTLEDVRVNAARQSVEKALNPLLRSRYTRGVGSGTGRVVTGARYMDGLVDTLSASIPLMDVDRPTSGRHMEALIDGGDLFLGPASDRLTEAGEALFENIRRALVRYEGTHTFSLSLIAEGSGPRAQRISRLMTLFRAARDIGFPSSRLVMSTESGPSGRFRFVFRVAGLKPEEAP